MKKALYLLLSILLIAFSSCKQSDDKTRVLLITGGHAFDTAKFFSVFNSIEGIELDTVSQPGANEFLTTEEGKNYEVYVFYDMWQKITGEQKEAYQDITESGKGLLFMHHSLVSYQHWDEFMELVGGRYVKPSADTDSSLHSDYTHDIELEVSLEDKDHPILSSMSDFTILDEGYGNLSINDDVHTLLTTNHPDCHQVIGWTNKFNNSDIVYLIFGHDTKAYTDEDFQQLIENSIFWLAGEQN